MTPEGITRKLIAILSADVKDYTRLMSQDDVGTIRTLTAYKEAMDILIRRYRGSVVDATGDNVLARFDSVLDAVNAAAEIQRDLAERNADLPYHRRMEFRMGVSLGDVVEEEGRIYGDGVNVAARLQALAEGGGICVSGMAYDHVKGKLGFEFEDLGEQTLKNIAEPVRVYRVLSLPGAAAHRVKEAKNALRRKWVKIALAAGVFLVIAGGLLWRFVVVPSRAPQVASPQKMAHPLPDKPSVAVLPFVNLSGDKSHEYIADGMTEDIISALARFKHLFVIASSSTFTQGQSGEGAAGGRGVRRSVCAGGQCRDLEGSHPGHGPADRCHRGYPSLGGTLRSSPDRCLPRAGRGGPEDRGLPGRQAGPGGNGKGIAEVFG